MGSDTKEKARAKPVAMMLFIPGVIVLFMSAFALGKWSTSSGAPVASIDSIPDSKSKAAIKQVKSKSKLKGAGNVARVMAQVKSQLKTRGQISAEVKPSKSTVDEATAPVSTKHESAASVSTKQEPALSLPPKQEAATKATQQPTCSNSEPHTEYWGDVMKPGMGKGGVTSATAAGCCEQCGQRPETAPFSEVQGVWKRLQKCEYNTFNISNHIYWLRGLRSWPRDDCIRISTPSPDTPKTGKNQPSRTSECGQTPGCNTWVWCGGGWCEKQCWLKWQANPEHPVVHGKGEGVPWTSGAIVKDFDRHLVKGEPMLATSAAGSAPPEVVVLRTHKGDIRIRLHPDWGSPPSVDYVRRVALHDITTVKTVFYRAEPGFLLQGSLHSTIAANNHTQTRAKGTPMEKGDVAWAGGFSGPDFFITMNKIGGFGGSHTGWGQVADKESMQVAEELSRVQVTVPKGGGMRMIDDPVAIKVTLPP